MTSQSPSPSHTIPVGLQLYPRLWSVRRVWEREGVWLKVLIDHTCYRAANYLEPTKRRRHYWPCSFNLCGIPQGSTVTSRPLDGKNRSIHRLSPSRVTRTKPSLSLFHFVAFRGLSGCGNLSRVLLEFCTPYFIGLATILFDGWVSIRVEMPNSVTSSSTIYILSGIYIPKKKAFTLDWTLW